MVTHADCRHHKGSGGRFFFFLGKRSVRRTIKTSASLSQESLDLEHGQHYLLARGILLYFWLHSAGVKRPPPSLCLARNNSFSHGFEGGIQRWMPGGQSCVKEEKKKMDGGDSIPGNVHEEQEDVEIVKVDCMCV